ncbi:MAG: AAA family ATPase [Anaerolineales bacterium]|nr:AAA family ATPase [Anaerolineales bacterium]
MNTLFDFARQLHQWGANVTAIKPGTKRPLHKWQHWQHQRQTEEEFYKLPWEMAAALGLVNGSGNFRSFDIDAPKDENGRPLYQVPLTVLIACLQAIRLPDDYQWSYISGSGAGWGFIVRCEEPLPADLFGDTHEGVITGIPLDGLRFDHLELRWSSGQTVIAGAHPTGPGYQWRLEQPPFVPPAIVSAERIANAFMAVACLKQLVISKPSRQEKAGGLQHQYGQGALISAVQRVETAVNGTRNNTLFQETAGLVELVNAGVLDSVDVNPAMLQAAALVGLPEKEAEATIDSAFKHVGDKVRELPQSIENEGVRETAVLPSSRVLSLKTMPMAALLSQSFAPLIFLVEGLIAFGHLVVLAGRPKSGKSWLVLQLMMCIDTGRPFLNRQTRKAKVLYIALEDGKRRVYQRANLLKWQPENAVVVFEIARFDSGDGLPGPGLAQIEEAANDFDLIIIDTLIATLSGRANENDNTEMGAIINTLARIAHETDTAIVLVHHTGKSFSDDVFNTLRGASAIRGGYDVGLLLERKPDEKEAILHAESRDVDVENMTLRQMPNGMGWEYVGNSKEIQKIRAGKITLDAMLEIDPDGVGVTVKEIAEHRDVSESAIYKQINPLVEKGHVGKIERPSTVDGKQPDLFYVREPYR